jgi:caa(3)-type oxidase subunit IV
MDKEKRAAFRTINVVAAVLLVLTILEFVLADSFGVESAAIFFVIALVKGGLVVNFFMHVYRLWRSEEAHS